jgi:hypothetical protein
MPIDIDFGLSLDTKGYDLNGGRIVGKGGSKRQMRLKEFPHLYLEFAKAQSPDALLNFVSRFGRLTYDREGDNVRSLLQGTKIMSRVLEMMRGMIGNLPKWPSGRTFEYEVPSLGGKIVGGIPIAGKLTAALIPDPMTGTWQLQLSPPTLLDAIWLQFGQALTSNAQLRQCDHCGKWFEAGVGTGRRADAKFCSSQCQIEHKSLERSRKER